MTGFSQWPTTTGTKSTPAKRGIIATSAIMPPDSSPSVFLIRQNQTPTMSSRNNYFVKLVALTLMVSNEARFARVLHHLKCVRNIFDIIQYFTRNNKIVPMHFAGNEITEGAHGEST